MALESKQRGRRKFPWWPLVLLLVTAYLFWVLPYQVGDRPIDVEFEAPDASP
ncbi:MAG: hypothetical protein IH945_09615 [Armatimonadetes bacterium]|nr:hypothetical protein [Armatimonadota bacterium]